MGSVRDSLPSEHDAAGPDEDALQCQECEMPAEYEPCVICLEPLPDQTLTRVRVVERLPCKHKFCRSCLQTYLTGRIRAVMSGQARDREAFSCPICKVPHDRNLLEAIVPGRKKLALRQALGKLADAPACEAADRSDPPAPSPSAEREYRRWAQRNHVKSCPCCSVPIEKTGGCASMVCRACGTGFKWGDAALICPCRGYHYKKAPPFLCRCKDVKRMDPVASVAYRAQKGVIFLSFAPVVVAAAAVAISVVLPLEALKHHHRKQKRRARARQQRENWEKRNLANLAAANYRQGQLECQRLTACRQTGRHKWVAGWCEQCGVLSDQVFPAVLNHEGRALVTTAAPPPTPTSAGHGQRRLLRAGQMTVTRVR